MTGNAHTRRPLLRPFSEGWDWQRSARCRDADPALFFHPDGERGGSRRHREDIAKAICASCPVRIQCRDHSLVYAEPFGIWGGLSETERGRLLDW